MTENMTRRRLLVASSGLFAGLAGCLSDDDGSEDDSTDLGTDQQQDDESSFGGDDQPQGGGDDDDSERDDSGEPDTGEADDESQDTGSGEGNAIMSEVVEWDPSYAIEITFGGEQSGEVTQTVHQGDTHIVMDMGGMEAEAYEVDGTKYEVAAGQCFIRENPEAEEQVPEVDGPRGDPPEIEATETTTIEGESVYVFEMPDEAEAIWYVSTSTGYPVRFETQAFTADFHSWGDTDPISPPDMDCQEV